MFALGRSDRSSSRGGATCIARVKRRRADPRSPDSNFAPDDRASYYYLTPTDNNPNDDSCPNNNCNHPSSHHHNGRCHTAPDNITATCPCSCGWT